MIHTYSGYEKKVKTDLDQKIDALGMRGIVTRILVPEEKTLETVTVRKKEVVKEISRKLFPGYVMLEMEATREETDNGINYKVDSDAWYVVRNTNGVTGFVGVGSDPIPMEESEVENIFKIIGYEEENPVIREVQKVDFEVGDFVKIISGGFEGYEGKIYEINTERRTVTITVDIMGRMTPFEVEYNSVQKSLKI